MYYRARWYDPVLGKFLNDDPMGFAAGDANVSRYVRNAASQTNDATGLMPNQHNAQELQQIIRFLELWEARHPELTPSENLERFLKHIKGPSYPLGNGMIEEPWVYVYTEKQGWIDMPHFIEAAVWAREGWDPLLVNGGGIIVEMHQVLQGRNNPQLPGLGSSGNSPEDYRSNNMGAIFGETFVDDIPLSKQLNTYFEEHLTPLKPTDYPYLQNLPLNEAEWEEIWRNNKPRVEVLHHLIEYPTPPLVGPHLGH